MIRAPLPNSLAIAMRRRRRPATTVNQKLKGLRRRHAAAIGNVGLAGWFGDAVDWITGASDQPEETSAATVASNTELAQERRRVNLDVSVANAALKRTTERGINLLSSLRLGIGMTWLAGLQITPTSAYALVDWRYEPVAKGEIEAELRKFASDGSWSDAAKTYVNDITTSAARESAAVVSAEIKSLAKKAAVAGIVGYIVWKAVS